jgi:hypothetical protein
MRKVTYFIDPKSNRIDGYTYKIYTSGEPIPAIPSFLIDENNQTTGIMYIKPLCVITGYNPDYMYKTYNSETNTFI